MTETASMNLIALIEQFGSEERSIELLEELRWPKGITCPQCAATSISRLRTRGQFECNSCRYQFSVTSGTMMHDTHLPLWKWLLATYLMIEAKKGVSANQLKRTLGVSYKTAWYLCQRIRAAMKDASTEPLRGVVEVDETLVGGKQFGVGRGNRKGKTLVVGAAERGGEVRLQRITRADRETLRAFIHRTAAPDTLHTDDMPAYRGIADEGVTHTRVRHKGRQWVQDGAHTNTVENVWSLFKRSVMGSYHKVSEKHIDAYLDELEWRFNNRDNPYLFRNTLLRLLGTEHVEYKELVKQIEIPS